MSLLALCERSFAPSQLVEKRLAVNRFSPQERFPPLVDLASDPAGCRLSQTLLPIKEPQGPTENLGRGTITARGYLALNDSLDLWSKRHTHGRHAALAFSHLSGSVKRKVRVIHPFAGA
ncbi:MAG: hypothetical protein NT090_02915, partial [Acidobacteria bacterium]|nr:hypothetical protein [Acidobacteriota bacterium]